MPACALPGTWPPAGTPRQLPPRPLSAAERRALGFPVPSEQWHGDSSVAAARRARPPRRAPDQDHLPTWPALREPPGAEAGLAELARPLRDRFSDPRRHFVFEYYPWYETNPWFHWNENQRTPPVDVAAFAMPRLGPYDSGEAAVIEQHARWIAEAGVGAVNLSWWGPGSATDSRVPLIMDVMRAHDVHVTFHLEPYSDDRPNRYADDVLYLLREYGEKRRWDALLLLEHADGTSGPVFKSFRTIVFPTTTDCHGTVYPVPDYVTEDVWRRQTDRVRDTLRSEFDRVTLFADSSDVGRVIACGFDGFALYDPFVRPPEWTAIADWFDREGLLVSFNTNIGFDKYPVRGPQGDCDRPLAFEPPVGPIDWSSTLSRESALAAERSRVVESLRQTLLVQLDARRSNATRGFCLVYINSFNEWHEGTAFEPAKDLDTLTAAERAIGYHNPPDGLWRLECLQELLAAVCEGRETSSLARAS